MKQFLSSIDIYDKFSAEEYRIRTAYGALLSFFLSMFGSILFFVQFIEFVLPDFSRELMIDRNLTSNMDRVNISISILINEPCFLLTIGNLDSLGINKFYNSTIRFLRYSRRGQYLGLANNTQNLNLNLSKKWQRQQKEHDPNFEQNTNKCYSCYGIRREGECCNSCEELYLLHLMKKKTPQPEKWEQCKGKDFDYLKNNISLDEACQIKGKLTVNKVYGNFNIVYGSRSVYNTYGSSIYMRSSISDEYPYLNFSHVIDKLRFGPKFIMTARPLDDTTIIYENTKNLATYKYDLVCTLVFLMKDGEVLAKTFEYTALPTTIPVTEQNQLVPGIFFYYKFTPYAVVVNLRYKPVSKLLGMTFGVLSGVYAITMIIDGVIYKAISEKKQAVIGGEDN